MIGKFEELALIALIKAGPDAHAISVYDVLSSTLGKDVSFPALYTALDRMVKKGMISEKPDDSDKRTRRLFTITGEGRRALGEAVNATRAVSEYGGVPVFGGG